MALNKNKPAYLSIKGESPDETVHDLSMVQICALFVHSKTDTFFIAPDMKGVPAK